MLVKEIMSRDLIWCTPSDTAQAAAKLMKDRGVGALPVVSDGAVKKLEGIVTDRDLCCTSSQTQSLPKPLGWQNS